MKYLSMVKKRYAIVGKLPNSDVEKTLLTRCGNAYITNLTVAQRLRNDMENEYNCKDCRVVVITKKSINHKLS